MKIIKTKRSSRNQSFANRRMSSAQDPKPPTAGADLTDEERLAVVKEIYGRGSRNYLVKEYAQAADDLSEACALYAEIYGEGAHELGMPYLLYAKSLIALAQGGENKLLEVPEEQEDDDDEDDDGEENSEEAPAAPAAEEGEAAGTSNGKPSVNGTNGTTEPQAGGLGSAVPAAVNTDGAEEEDDDSPAANLQVAWEVLELAVKIFDKGGEASASNLADAYFELAEISLENSHFETAVRDYSKLVECFFKPVFCSHVIFFAHRQLAGNQHETTRQQPAPDRRNPVQNRSEPPDARHVRRFHCRLPQSVRSARRRNRQPTIGTTATRTSRRHYRRAARA